MLQDSNLQNLWLQTCTYEHLPLKYFSPVQPEIFPSPSIVLFNDVLANGLGILSQAEERLAFTEWLSGGAASNSKKSIAQAYAGHQFGHFTMLGDGRALLLGEHLTPSKERVDIHLKGTGKTPYSRGGDGRATLGPMLREYIMSEAMEALAIPTSRSLAVILTGESVQREKPLPGALLVRVASSHIRVGTFEFASVWGTLEERKALLDYTIARHYPEAYSDENPALYFVKSVIKKQAQLIAKWQLVGFIHGVMNTDNMLICGETIDYGPCAFMNEYHPETVFSSIDTYGRYAYKQQPLVAKWNLSRFIETMIPFLHQEESIAIQLGMGALGEFDTIFHQAWIKGFLSKLGIFHQKSGDQKLVNELLQILNQFQADYIHTLWAISRDKIKTITFSASDDFSIWVQRLKARQVQENYSAEKMSEWMKKNNPTVIPRNDFVENAIESAVVRQDYTPIHEFIKVLKSPYEDTELHLKYARVLKSSNKPYKTYCGT